MNMKKVILPLLLTAISSLAFAQYERGEIDPLLDPDRQQGNTWMGIRTRPGRAGETITDYKVVYAEDSLQGKEAGMRGEEDNVWLAPTAQVELEANKPADFNTETAYVYALNNDVTFAMESASYRVAEHEPNGEQVKPSSDRGDTPAQYVPWKGRVDFKFIKEMTENGPVLKVLSHVVNPHGVRLEKATIKVKEDKKGLAVEVRMPKAEWLRWIGQTPTLKFQLVDVRQDRTAKQVKAKMLGK